MPPVGVLRSGTGTVQLAQASASLTPAPYDRHMENLAVLAFVWALIFAMLVLPTRLAGRWIVRRSDSSAGTAASLSLCFVLAWGAVLLGWLALKVGGRVIFPYVDARYFGLPYVALLLFVPSCAALIAGYLHARKAAGRRTLSSFLPPRFKELLADLLWLVMSAVFLGFGGWSLLRWYETGRIAGRRRDFAFDTEPFLFSFEFFRSGLMFVLGLLGVLAFLALRNYRRGNR